MSLSFVCYSAVIFQQCLYSPRSSVFFPEASLVSFSRDSSHSALSMVRLSCNDFPLFWVLRSPSPLFRNANYSLPRCFGMALFPAHICYGPFLPNLYPLCFHLWLLDLDSVIRHRRHDFEYPPPSPSVVPGSPTLRRCDIDGRTAPPPLPELPPLWYSPNMCLGLLGPPLL